MKTIKSGVYVIRCVINQGVYVGSSSNIPRRWTQHKCALRAKKHHSYKLQTDWDRYGESNFTLEIAEEVLDGLIAVEQSYIDALNSCRQGYNVAPLAYAGTGQPRHYEERKEKVTVRITPTAIASLDRIATALGISRSELMERIARAGDEEIMAIVKHPSHTPNVDDGLPRQDES